jgi:hypothetical protein
MRYLLPSRASELLAMNRSRLRIAVGLLTGHTKLRARLHKLGYTKGKNADSVDMKRKPVYTLRVAVLS